MSQLRKSWDQSTADLLIQIVQKSENPVNWVLVAQDLNSLVPAAQRSSKQCRERWNLEASKKKQDGNEIVDLHDFFSIYKEVSLQKNKWKKIAATLQDRKIVNWDQNSVKNFFYCSIRKALRKINKLIPSRFDPQIIRKIKPSSLSRLCNNSEYGIECLELFEQILVHKNVASTNNGFARDLLMKLLQIDQEYVNEKQEVRSPREKKRRSSLTLSQSSRVEEKDDEEIIINLSGRTYSTDDEQLIRPPTLCKNSEEMFFPDLSEILGEGGESVMVEQADDIGIYLAL